MLLHKPWVSRHANLLAVCFFSFASLDAYCRILYSSASFGYATDLGSVHFLCSLWAVFFSVRFFDRIKISCSYLLTINFAFRKKNDHLLFLFPFCFCWMELPKWEPWGKEAHKQRQWLSWRTGRQPRDQNTFRSECDVYNNNSNE